MNTEYNCFTITPFAPNLGAEIRDLDLSKELTSTQFEEVRRAFLEYQVLFFKDQKEIPPATQIEFGKSFGELHAHPAAPTMQGYPEIFEIYTDKNSKIANGEF
jgi:taurine dioxygenase